MPEEESTKWKNRGDEFVKNEQYEDAIKCYTEAVRINPDLSGGWNNMGFALNKLGRKEEAKKCRDMLNSIKNKEERAKKTDNNPLKNPEKENESKVNESPDIENTSKFKQQPEKKIQIHQGIQKISKIFTEKSLGALDTLGGAVKSGSRNISYNILKRKQTIHIKDLIIAEFSFKELKNMCLYFNLGGPIIIRLNKYNELQRYTPTYIEWKLYARKRLSLVKLKEYAKTHNRLPYKIIELEEHYKTIRKQQYPEYERDEDVISDGTSEGAYNGDFLDELINAIKEYRPIKPFKNELLYHTNLYTYLCQRIPQDIHFEEQRGSSRPDIAVGDIAIEIKGPTDRQALVTIADKVNRYSQFYEHVIVVLFEVEIFERYYHEWYEGIIRQYQNQVTIIRK